MEVHDNGTGPGPGGWSGGGLSTMRERAEELGGVLTVEPREQGGTVVAARLPLASPAAQVEP